MRKRQIFKLSALLILTMGVLFVGTKKIKENKAKEKNKNELNERLIPNTVNESTYVLQRSSGVSDSVVYYTTKNNDSTMHSQLKILEKLLESAKDDIYKKFWKEYTRVLYKYPYISRESGYTGNDFASDSLWCLATKMLWYYSDGIIQNMKGESFSLPAVYRERNCSSLYNNWTDYRSYKMTGKVLSSKDFYKMGADYQVIRQKSIDILSELILALRATHGDFITESPYQDRNIDVFEREYKELDSYSDILALLNVTQQFVCNIDNSKNVISRQTLNEIDIILKEWIEKLSSYIEQAKELESVKKWFIANSLTRVQK